MDEPEKDSGEACFIWMAVIATVLFYGSIAGLVWIALFG